MSLRREPGRDAHRNSASAEPASPQPARPSITNSDEIWDVDSDIPNLTAEELATMRPARNALPPEGSMRGDRPKTERRKFFVTPRLDQEVVEALKATGPA